MFQGQCQGTFLNPSSSRTHYQRVHLKIGGNEIGERKSNIISYFMRRLLKSVLHTVGISCSFFLDQFLMILTLGLMMSWTTTTETCMSKGMLRKETMSIWFS